MFSLELKTESWKYFVAISFCFLVFMKYSSTVIKILCKRSDSLARKNVIRHNVLQNKYVPRYLLCSDNVITPITHLWPSPDTCPKTLMPSKSSSQFSQIYQCRSSHTYVIHTTIHFDNYTANISNVKRTGFRYVSFTNAD